MVAPRDESRCTELQKDAADFLGLLFWRLRFHFGSTFKRWQSSVMTATGFVLLFFAGFGCKTPHSVGNSVFAAVS